MVYLSGSSGHGLFPSYEAQIKEFSPLRFLTRLRSFPGDADKILESTALSSYGLNHLQARIFVKPRLMGDNSRVQIKRYFKTPCAAAYFTELRHLVREDVSQWIQNRYSLAPDTLENPESATGDEALPPLQKVVRHQQQSQGKTYQSRFRGREAFFSPLFFLGAEVCSKCSFPQDKAPGSLEPGEQGYFEGFADFSRGCPYPLLTLLSTIRG